MSALEFRLGCNRLGRLVLTTPDGQTHEDVVPVRAFPIAAPDQGIALLSADGHELVWIEHLDGLPAETRSLVEAALASREFMPEILRIDKVSAFATPSTWQVTTDRGATRLILRGEEDIHRLPGGVLLIADSHGVQFLIRDPARLDRHSRKLLDRFL
ncbi:uncharacterized protein DUF1854 [Sulfuritortus calidifontis]|uniref:Uncharacterized protein DUF1854 n=1 Tax=Sulfuritortus calidifontis TaxID=1914471 RepID=A0A4R3JU39_9PROT|nr:DUF1854 domain-containing protein [Sulfuritortus calidifontis]TCS71176.1 uncharacterized protein DUF1854 [Sulfuritortus calidifontis]